MSHSYRIRLKPKGRPVQDIGTVFFGPVHIGETFIDADGTRYRIEEIEHQLGERFPFVICKES